MLDELRVVEEVTLVAGSLDGFLRRFSEVYQPEVERRGYRLAHCMVSPPIDIDGEPVRLRMVWSLDGLVTARAASPRWDLRLVRDASPEATAFWDGEGAHVVDRIRQVMRVLEPPFATSVSIPAPAAGTTANVPAPVAGAAIRCIVLVHVAEHVAGDTALLAQVAGELQDALRSELGDVLQYTHISPHRDVSPVGGHMTWDVVIHSDAGPAFTAAVSAVKSALVESVRTLDAVAVTPLSGAVPEPGLRDLTLRTLLFRVPEDARPGGAEELEDALVGMVDHIPAIRNWSLSRVAPLTEHPGIPRWTHAWEQEYAEVDGLVHDYLEALYHWAHVDAFYDSDDPRGVVEMPLAHVFGPAAESVLAPVMAATGFPVAGAVLGGTRCGRGRSSSTVSLSMRFAK